MPLIAKITPFTINQARFHKIIVFQDIHPNVPCFVKKKRRGKLFLPLRQTIWEKTMGNYTASPMNKNTISPTYQ